MTRKVTVAQRVAEIAAAEPDREAVVTVDHRGRATTTTFRELDHRANHCARVLAAHGATRSEPVVVALPNGIDHVVATLASWKLGAVVVSLDPHAPGREAAAMVAAAGPAVLVGALGGDRPDPGCPVLAPAAWGTAEDPRPLPAPTAPPRSALATSGSTGLPRVVLRRRSWEVDVDALVSEHERTMGLDVDQNQLVCFPLHHGGFGALHHGLALGHRIVLMTMFAPRAVLDAVERYRVQVMRLAPTMMALLLEVPGVERRDLSSVRAVHHGTGPCPPEVKRAWMDLVGPAAVFETYSSQEQLGFVWIRGDEWLAHPGSVGRPAPGAVRVLDDARRPVPPGETGQIFFRPTGGGQPEYLGPGPRLAAADGYLTTGDLGFLDEDGYLFVVGRADDAINVGGAKLNPGEVEEVLRRHPGILDACVVGHPDPARGQVPHAVLVAGNPPPSFDDLDRHCRELLSPYKVPVRYRLVESLRRNELGKLQRWRWRDGDRA